MNDLVNCATSLNKKLTEVKKETKKLIKLGKRKQFPKLNIKPGQIITNSEFIDNLKKQQEETARQKKKKLLSKKKKRKQQQLTEEDKENSNPNIQSIQHVSMVIKSTNLLINNKKLIIKQ